MADFAVNRRFLDWYVTPVPGRTMIAGSKVYPGRDDMREDFDDAFGIDMEEGDGVDFVHNLEKKLPDTIGKFSHIVCASVLEHSRKPWLLAANLEKVLERGGSIYVDAPTVWRFHGYPSDYWRFTHAGIAVLFPKIDWQDMRYSDAEGELHSPPKIPHTDGLYSKTQIHAFGYRK